MESFVLCSFEEIVLLPGSISQNFLNFKEQIILMMLNFPAHNRKEYLLIFFVKPVNTKFDKVSTIKL